MKHCNVCNTTKPIAEFYHDNRASDGHKKLCKFCADLRSRESRRKTLKRNNHVRAQYRKSTKDKFRKWKEMVGCSFCNENFGPCLELHHLDPKEKDYTPTILINFSFKKLMEEAQKCILVCSNCHRKIHYGKINVSVEDIERYLGKYAGMV